MTKRSNYSDAEYRNFVDRVIALEHLTEAVSVLDCLVINQLNSELVLPKIAYQIIPLVEQLVKINSEMHYLMPIESQVVIEEYE